MLVTYLYDTDKDTTYLKSWPEIYDVKEVFKRLDNYNIELISFPGVNSYKYDSKKMNDSIITYKK